jgi:hypothetical protein
LGPGGLQFGYPLNLEVRIPKPGTYSCVAIASDVTATPFGEPFRPALLLKSDPLVLKIVNDSTWANAAAEEYGGLLEKNCPQVPLEFKQRSQCWDLSRRIVFLETPAALKIAVSLINGRPEKWSTGFWEAIQKTQYRSDAVRLLTARMQEPDFQASPQLVELLAIWDLHLELPDAFGPAPPSAYTSQAQDILRKYVRLLGSSLGKKQSDILAENAKTYRHFAQASFCSEDSLISPEERAQVLAGLEIPEER